MKRALVADDLLKIVTITDPQASPDGKRIAFTKSTVNDKFKVIGHVCSVDVATREVTQWTQGAKGCGAGRWSPCGKFLAFVSGRDESGAQIHLISTSGGEAKPLTKLAEGSVGEIKWSRCGTMIAFTYRPTDPERTKKAEEERKENGRSTPPWVVENLWYRLDGDGFFGAQRYGVYVVEVATGDHQMVCGDDVLGDYSFDWLADSSGLIIGHGVEERPFQDPRNDQFFIVTLDGTKKRIESQPKGSKGAVAVSPDGTKFAYLAEVCDEDPYKVLNSRVWVSDFAGPAKCLTPNDDYDCAAMNLTDTGAGAQPGLFWHGETLYVSVATQGEQQIGVVDSKSGGLKIVSSGTHLLGVGAPGGDTIPAILASWDKPNEIAVWNGNKAEPLTNFNEEWLAEIDLVEPKSHRVESDPGVKVQAWVMSKQPTSPQPTVIEVHGGPHTQYALGFFIEFQLLCAQGYTVVFSNPRGSKGYGEEFADCIRDQWGEKDWTDVKAVSDWAKAQSFCDPKNLAIMGGSYGGFMTNWAISHSKDYKVAISDRCVFNWLSMCGNSDYPSWSDAYFTGQFWGERSKTDNLWKQSPCAYFDDVSTPTLVIHSEGDLRCNVEQAEQLFSVLQIKGVPSKFVRYPLSTSHGLSRNGPPDLRIHRLHQIVDWLGKYLV